MNYQQDKTLQAQDIKDAIFDIGKVATRAHWHSDCQSSWVSYQSKVSANPSPADIQWRRWYHQEQKHVDL